MFQVIFFKVTTWKNPLFTCANIVYKRVQIYYEKGVQHHNWMRYASNMTTSRYLDNKWSRRCYHASLHVSLEIGSVWRHADHDAMKAAT